LIIETTPFLIVWTHSMGMLPHLAGVANGGLQVARRQ